MKNRFKVVSAIVAVVLAGGLLTACHHHRYGGHGDPEKMAEKLVKHLDGVLTKIDATEEQRSKIRLIADQIVADARQIHGRNTGQRGDTVARLLADNPDREWLHRQMDEKAKAVTEFGHRTLDRLIEINAILTPAQRAELHQRFASAHGAKKQ